MPIAVLLTVTGIAYLAALLLSLYFGLKKTEGK